MSRARRQPPPVPPSLGTRPKFIHGCYYPSWRVYRGANPSSMNIDIVTHVFYAFARTRADGTIYHLDEKADLELDVDGLAGCIRACVELKKHRPNLNVLVSVGGGSGSESFSQIASKVDSREAFAISAHKFISKYEFDGIDLDWEHPADREQGRDYVLLLQALRKHVPSPLQVTSALPAGEWCLRNIDLMAAAKSLDFVNLMCYDFAGPWTELSGHQAQLFTPSTPHSAFARRSGDAAVTYLLSHEVPASKIVIGIPVYGRSFKDTTTIGQRFSESTEFEYKDLPPPGSMEFIDDRAVAAGCVGTEGGFITYDLPATVARKAQYVKQNGLGGLFYWTGVADAAPGPRSLMTAGYEILKGS